nr:MLV-related proviral Env polyprotein-like isoform X2 [Peromyscus maniculatus bairdii]
MISLYLTLLLLPGATTEISQPDNPHTPWNQTWIIISGGSNPNRIISRISSVAPRDTWFPDLYADLCDLGGRMWGPSGNEPDILPNGKELSAFAVGCDTPGGRAKARQLQFYVCPGHSMTKERRQKCGGENYAFCGSWGCESTGSISWDPPTKGDFITTASCKTSTRASLQRR